MSEDIQQKVKNNEPMQTHLTKISIVDLPLSATEDRVCGTIDIERALHEGIKAFEPGLLAKPNRGILYADEIRPQHVVLT